MAKNKESTPAPSAASELSSSRIDLVKELIFGDDLATTRQAIVDLEAKLGSSSNALSEKIESRLKELEESISARLQALEMKTQTEIDRLSNEKADRQVLGKMLEEIGKSLQNG